MTMANMAVEAGAKCAIFAPDKKTAEFCKLSFAEIPEISGDEDGNYIKGINYDAEDFVPVVACPPCVDKIKSVSELEGLPIDQVFIGSCTNGRLEDLKIAAEILKNKKIANHIRLIVAPASRNVYMEAAKAGYLKTLTEAGAIITHPGCGLCCGRAGGILTEKERVLATNNRNFLGRMGPPSAEIYLGSPAVAASSSIKGTIALPV